MYFGTTGGAVSQLLPLLQLTVLGLVTGRVQCHHWTTASLTCKSQVALADRAVLQEDSIEITTSGHMDLE